MRRQLLPDDGLPFGDVLSVKTLSRSLATIEGRWNDRGNTPLAGNAVLDDLTYTGLGLTVLVSLGQPE